MFCVNCGTTKHQGARFCGKCGTGFSEYQPQHEEYFQPKEATPTSELPPAFQTTTYREQTFAQPTTPEPARKRRGVTIAAACLLVAALAVGGMFGFRLLASPSLAVSRAVNNSTSELSERLATSPLQAFELVMGSLENGTVNVAFDYTSIWRNWWTDETETDTYNGHFSLTSNARTNNMALRGNMQVSSSPNVSFAAYINPERVAFGSPNLCDNYYGFRFDSFRQDIVPFGRALGILESDMNMVSDIVEEIGSWITRGNTSMEELKPYIEAFTSFLLDAESGSERGEEVRVGFETITARRVDYAITISDLVELLNTWIDMLENDDTIRALFDSPMYTTMYGNNAFDSMIRELRWGVQEIEDNLRGRITLSFYIGRGSRLVQVALRGNLTVDGDSISFRVAMNFGNSATDRWALTGSVTDSWGTYSFNAFWDIERQDGRHVNIWQIEHEHDEVFTITSDWNPTTGGFTFSLEEIGRWGTWDEELLSGNFTTDGETFRLAFHHEDDWNGSTLDLEIYTTTDNNAGADINFINIDRWGDELLDRLEDLFWDLGW